MTGLLKYRLIWRIPSPLICHVILNYLIDFSCNGFYIFVLFGTIWTHHSGDMVSLYGWLIHVQNVWCHFCLRLLLYKHILFLWDQLHLYTEITLCLCISHDFFSTYFKVYAKNYVKLFIVVLVSVSYVITIF